MKRTFFIAIIFLASQSFAYDIRLDDGQIITSKYQLNGRPIFSDTEKAQLLSQAVDTGTGTINDASFVPDTVPALDQGVVNEISGTMMAGSRTMALAEIERRTSKAYNLALVSYWRNQYSQDMAVSSTTTFDFSATTATDIANFNRYKVRFLLATH